MRVLIVAEIRLYREGLARSLSERLGFDAVATVSPSEDLSRAVVSFCPGICLLDVLGIESLELVGVIRKCWPELRIVALGVKNPECDVLTCAELGIQGIVSREASLEELVDVITAAAHDEFRCSSRAAGTMAKHIAALTARHGDRLCNFHLTGRQVEIFRCIEGGMSNKEIARHLGIQLSTVKNHVHQVLEKLGVKRRSEAVARLYRSGRFTDIIEGSPAAPRRA